MNTDEQLLTIEEVAEFLRVSIWTVRKLVKTGKLKAITISSRGDKRFSKNDVDTYIKENYK